jgi:hypothetical protein
VHPRKSGNIVGNRGQKLENEEPKKQTDIALDHQSHQRRKDGSLSMGFMKLK